MTVRVDDDLRPAHLPAVWLALPATPAAARLARGFVSSTLSEVEPDVVDVAVLLTSELVANAVLHGRAPIRLQLHREHGTLRIEVYDAGRLWAPPPAAAWSLTSEGGRGLPLLAALATSWGSQSDVDSVVGKVVWFELAHHQAE